MRVIISLDVQVFDKNIACNDRVNNHLLEAGGLQ
jgi:hypothetical protein